MTAKKKKKSKAKCFSFKGWVKKRVREGERLISIYLPWKLGTIIIKISSNFLIILFAYVCPEFDYIHEPNTGSHINTMLRIWGEMAISIQQSTTV